MCHGARVDEQRNSSSRVQRHLTGRPDFSVSSARYRLGRRVNLAAEAASDRAADELELVQRHLQVGGDDAHREVQRLRAGVDRQPTVRLRHHLADLGLERAVLDRGRAIDAFDDHVRVVERPLDVALADLPTVHLRLEVRVPVAPLVDHGRIGIGAEADVEEGGLLGELELDRLDGRHRGRLVVGGDDRDRLPLVAHVVLREQRLVLGDAQGGQVAVRSSGTSSHVITA